MARWEDISWSSTSSTTSGTTTLYYTDKNLNAYGEHVKPTKKSKPIKAFRDKAVGQAIVSNMLFGNMSMFAHRNSPAFRDRNVMGLHNISVYCTDPVIPGFGSPVALGRYDCSLIVESLEYKQDTMDKANLIKESLATLRKKSVSHTLILARTPEMVSELAIKNKYDKIEDGLFIRNEKGFNGQIIRGVTTEEIIALAYMARSAEIIEDISIETDLACVRAYLYKQD